MIATASASSPDDELRQAIRRRALARPPYQWIQTPATVRYAILAGITFALAMLLFLASQSPTVPSGPDDASSLVVRLIDPAPVPIDPTPATSRHLLVRMPPDRAVRHAARRDVSDLPQPLSPPAPTASTPALHLFNRDGRISIPPPPEPGRLEAQLQRAHELAHRGHNLLRCRQSIFVPKVDEAYEAPSALNPGQVKEDFNARRAALAAAAAAAACDDQLVHRSFQPRNQPAAEGNWSRDKDTQHRADGGSHPEVFPAPR